MSYWVMLGIIVGIIYWIVAARITFSFYYQDHADGEPITWTIVVGWLASSVFYGLVFGFVIIPPRCMKMPRAKDTVLEQKILPNAWLVNIN